MSKNKSEDNKECKKKDLERDKFLFKLMQDCYNSEEQRNRDVDTKSFTFIAIIGVMFTIQSTLLIKVMELNNIVLIIFFLTSLILYFLAIYNFIQAVNYKIFKSLPEQNALIDYYSECKSYYDSISTLIGNYQLVINSNKDIIDNKVTLSKKGLKYLLWGLVTTIAYIVIIFIII